MHNSIEEKLDQLKACVHCGMCLPACPTYLTTGNEGHSPRGRLYLIRDHVESSLRGAEGETIPSHVIASEAKRHPERSEGSRPKEIATPTTQARDDNEKTIHYLDACLECRACETVCPSGVEYANILDYARHEKNLTNNNKGFYAFIRRLSFKYLLANRNLLSLLRKSLVITRSAATKQSSTRHCEESASSTKQSSDRHCEPKAKQSILAKLQSLLKLSPRLEQAYIKIQTNHTYQSKHPQAITVSLPLGCVMDTLYNHVHWDTIKVLNALGYNVYIPETQCCGALASHSGEHKLGSQQTQATLKTLSKNTYPVVMNSAGCGAHLKQTLPSHCEERSDEAISSQVITSEAKQSTTILDFIELIQNDLNKLATKLKNDKAISVTYHPACHLNHAQGIRTEYQELLKLIPNLTLIPLAEADVCCGSAGFYNLIHPQMADAIGARKAGNIKNSKAEILVTANPGCISQIQAHMPNQKILHPISLIAQYLND